MRDTKEINRNRQMRFIIILLLLVGIACISVGYSVFSTNLQINSLTYLSNKTWQIQFDNLDGPILNGGASQMEQPVITSTVINLKLYLDKNGDSATYLFDVKNAGSFDAVLESVPLISGIPDDLLDNIIVEVTHENDDPLIPKEELRVGEKVTNKLTITYNSDDISSETEDREVNINIILMYVQK